MIANTVPRTPYNKTSIKNISCTISRMYNKCYTQYTILYWVLKEFCAFY